MILLVAQEVDLLAAREEDLPADQAETVRLRAMATMINRQVVIANFPIMERAVRLRPRLRVAEVTTTMKNRLPPVHHLHLRMMATTRMKLLGYRSLPRP